MTQFIAGEPTGANRAEFRHNEAMAKFMGITSVMGIGKRGGRNGEESRIEAEVFRAGCFDKGIDFPPGRRGGKGKNPAPAVG